jgi:hypothetical protein
MSKPSSRSRGGELRAASKVGAKEDGNNNNEEDNTVKTTIIVGLYRGSSRRFAVTGSVAYSILTKDSEIGANGGFSARGSSSLGGQQSHNQKMQSGNAPTVM